ncbi:MAG: hypothetical protein HRU19_19260 [Pseudobacteriovorax sp.]|nr:hypothetical protein [Pseudobacteriovorax sp.]
MNVSVICDGSASPFLSVYVASRLRKSGHNLCKVDINVKSIDQEEKQLSCFITEQSKTIEVNETSSSTTYKDFVDTFLKNLPTHVKAG